MAAGSFLYKRIKAVGYALKGAIILLRTEPSIQVQACIATILTAAGFIFKISSTEWILQILAIALVMGLEGLNTAVEAIADFIHPEFNKKIGHIKDIAAGSVFIAAVMASIVGLIIYLPKIVLLF